MSFLLTRTYAPLTHRLLTMRLVCCRCNLWRHQLQSSRHTVPLDLKKLSSCRMANRAPRKGTGSFTRLVVTGRGDALPTQRPAHSQSIGRSHLKRYAKMWSQGGIKSGWSEGDAQAVVRVG